MQNVRRLLDAEASEEPELHESGLVRVDGGKPLRLFAPFVVPGSNRTTAWDVNARGEIVGVFRDVTANRFHGFVRDGSAYLRLDVPQAAATRAFGINAGGDVVGGYLDGAGRTRAFLDTRTR